jgi:hypothetical protein
MFSQAGRSAAYRMLEVTAQIVALQKAYNRSGCLSTPDIRHIEQIIDDLNSLSQPDGSLTTREAFLAVMALSTKLFLQMLLQAVNDQVQTDAACQISSKHLMEVLLRPEHHFCSTLTLCTFLESLLWQTMIGAIAARDTPTKHYYFRRLVQISDALMLRSWSEAQMMLNRFFWIPQIFDPPARSIILRVLNQKRST